MNFELRYTAEANENLIRLSKNEPKAFQKALRLLAELQEHPRFGTGHPEQLTGEMMGCWSRHITKKHRLIYEIHETEVIVLVLSAYGHYRDK